LQIQYRLQLRIKPQPVMDIFLKSMADILVIKKVGGKAKSCR
jgi:hypothetical protein